MDRLVQGGCSISEVAKKVALSVAQASKDLSLLTLPAELQEMVDNGTIHKTQGYELTKISDPAKQRALAEEMVNKRLTRDEAVLRRKAINGKAGNLKAVAVLGGGRSVSVTGPGLSLDTLLAWLTELCGLARKAKSQGLALDTFCRTLKDQKATGKGDPQ